MKQKLIEVLKCGLLNGSIANNLLRVIFGIASVCGFFLMVMLSADESPLMIPISVGMAFLVIVVVAQVLSEEL